jgi:CubicO group peptidase (beta-lactamase class C family)
MRPPQELRDSASRPLFRLAVAIALGVALNAAAAATPAVARSPQAAGAAADQEASWVGRWKGEIATPGRALAFEIDLREGAGGALEGKISVPAQGMFDVALADVAASASGIRFRIPDVPGDPTFDGALAAAAESAAGGGARVEGTFRQGGADLGFHMARGEDAAAAPKSALEGFDQLAESMIEDWNLPGIAIAIVAGGEVVFAKGFGFRDVEARKPMTPDTLFSIGSTTKAMTTTVLGMLVDDGKVEWDTPVRTYLPAFDLVDEDVAQRITPRDLVTHRSGMPRHDLLWYNYNEGTRADLVKRLAHLELTADLRERFQYNNLMFLTAGHLIETLTGKSWEDAVDERLFTPLGMERSSFSVLTAQQDPDHALPYREDEETRKIERIPFRRIDLVGPAGSVNSSVNEMTRWLLFNLRKGKAGEKQLLNASTLEDIHAPHMTIDAPRERPDISAPSYALGWMVDSYRGHRRIQHGGGIDGFITSVSFYPDDDVGIVAFTNIGSGAPSLLAQHAADRMLGLDAVDWNGEALAAMKKGREAAKAAEKKKDAIRQAGTRPSHPIGEYPGDYEHPGYGPLRIEAGAGNDLVVHINGIEAPLEHWHYDVWNGADAGDGDPTFEDTKFLFWMDFDGNVSAVEATLDQSAKPIAFMRKPDARLSDPEYLTRFVGKYAFAITGDVATVELSGNTLQATVPGQPRYTLVPGIDGRFSLKEAPTIKVGFEEEGGKVTKATFHQPQGVFEATKSP